MASVPNMRLGPTTRPGQAEQTGDVPDADGFARLLSGMPDAGGEASEEGEDAIAGSAVSAEASTETAPPSTTAAADEILNLIAAQANAPSPGRAAPTVAVAAGADMAANVSPGEPAAATRQAKAGLTTGDAAVPSLRPVSDKATIELGLIEPTIEGVSKAGSTAARPAAVAKIEHKSVGKDIKANTTSGVGQTGRDAAGAAGTIVAKPRTTIGGAVPTAAGTARATPTSAPTPTVPATLTTRSAATVPATPTSATAATAPTTLISAPAATAPTTPTSATAATAPTTLITAPAATAPTTLISAPAATAPTTTTSAPAATPAVPAPTRADTAVRVAAGTMTDTEIAGPSAGPVGAAASLQGEKPAAKASAPSIAQPPERTFGPTLAGSTATRLGGAPVAAPAPASAKVQAAAVAEAAAPAAAPARAPLPPVRAASRLRAAAADSMSAAVPARDRMVPTPPAIDTLLQDAAAPAPPRASGTVTPLWSSEPAVTAPAAETMPAMAAESPGQAIERQLDLAADGEWLDQLARDIAGTADREGRMRFRLNPERLGSLHVELEQRDQGTAVRLTVETEAARQLIVDAQPKLIAEARAQGVRIADSQVDLAGGQAGDSRRNDSERRDPLLRTGRGASQPAEDDAPRRRSGTDRYA